MPIANGKQLTRTPGDTNENLVHTGPCLVWNISPELTTTGTITLRDAPAAGDGSAVVKHVCAIGLTQAGKNLGGVLFPRGLTVQLSVATDLTGITWEAC